MTVAASVADLAGNRLGADDTWTFTTGAVILSVTDTTVADFSAGSRLACAVDATIGDGVVCMPLRSTKVSQRQSFLSDWTSTPLTGGTSTVPDGIVP